MKIQVQISWVGQSTIAGDALPGQSSISDLFLPGRSVPGGQTEPPHKKTRLPNLQKFFSCHSTSESLGIKQGWLIAWAQLLGWTGRRSGHPCLTQFGLGSAQLNWGRNKRRGWGEHFTQEWGKDHFLSNPEGPNQGKQVVVCFHTSFALNVSLKIKCHRSSDQFCCAGPPMGTLVPF